MTTRSNHPVNMKGLRNRVTARSESFPEKDRERFCALVLEPPTIQTSQGLRRDTSDPIKALFWEGYNFGPLTMKQTAPRYAFLMAGRYRHMLERYGHLPKACPEQESPSHAHAAPAQRLRSDHGSGRPRDGSDAHG